MATEKKAPAKKAPANKAAAKKSPGKTATGGRKYSPAASASVEREMKAMHEGKLRSGSTGEKVTNPKQAIAIGLAEARRAGADAPTPPVESAPAKKAGGKAKARKTKPTKTAARKEAARKSKASRTGPANKQSSKG